MESEEKESKTELCIPPEKLSAKLDGEYKFTSAERKHFDECPLCRNLYDSYALMSRKLSREIPSEFPEETFAKIRKSVHNAIRETERSRRSIPFSRRLLRIAALLAIFGGVTYLLRQTPEVRHSRNAEKQAASEKITTIQYDPREAVLSAGAVDIRNTRLSSTGPGFSFLAAEKTSPVRRTVVIPDFVKQVWLYPAGLPASDAAELLRRKFRNLGIDLKKTVISVPDANTVRAKISLTKKQLVLLCRELAGEKYKLLSGTPPQPEQNLFLGSAEDPVTSEIVLMHDAK